MVIQLLKRATIDYPLSIALRNMQYGFAEEAAIQGNASSSPYGQFQLSTPALRQSRSRGLQHKPKQLRPQ